MNPPAIKNAKRLYVGNLPQGMTEVSPSSAMQCLSPDVSKFVAQDQFHSISCSTAGGAEAVLEQPNGSNRGCYRAWQCSDSLQDYPGAHGGHSEMRIKSYFNLQGRLDV